jgi:hypothetical protein
VGESANVRLRMLLVETHFDMLNRYIRVKSHGRLNLRGGDEPKRREKEAVSRARKHFAELWSQHGSEVADEIMSGVLLRWMRQHPYSNESSADLGDPPV